MSTYLSRPIFPVDVNWADTPHKEFTYNLREMQLGFAGPRFEPLQLHTITGLEFPILLVDEPAVQAFDAFVASVRGRLNGFWLRSPLTAAVILGGISTTQFWIEDQGLTDSLADQPCRQWAFTKEGEETQYGQVLSVARLDGREQVTLSLDLGTAVDETWEAWLLYYVRFAEDDLAADFISPNAQERTLRVLELTEEYASIETGQQPVYLYEFYLELDPKVYWRFTGLNQDITSAGDLFSSGPIQHGQHVQSLKDDQGLSLESFYEDANPLSRFFPFTLPKPLRLAIYQVDYSTPDSRVVVFDGIVDSVKLQGTKITAQCITLLTAAGRTFPRFLIQPHCNYALFSAPCGLNMASYAVHGQIAELGIRRMKLISMDTDLRPYNDFAFGWLVVGSGQQTEIRTIDRSTAVVDGVGTFEFNAPLRFAQVGDSVTLYPGCDGEAVTCRDRYNNFARWGGHVIAPTNLSINAVTPSNANGNKK